MKNFKNKILMNEGNLSIYCLLAVIRVLLNFIPQTGYIHPDEYFQSIEVVAGILNNFYFIKIYIFN